MSMKARIIYSLFVPVLIAGFFVSAHSEEARPDSNREASGLNEGDKQFFEKLRKDADAIWTEAESSEEGREEIKALKREAQIKELVKKEKYKEARKSIDKEEKIDPGRERHWKDWRDVINKLEEEPDKKQREELYSEIFNGGNGGLEDLFVGMYDKKTTLEKIDQIEKDLKPQNSEEELCYAAEDGNRAKVDKLLGKGVSANAKDRYEETALAKAARQGNADIVRLLLAHGADANANFGSTALIAAASEGRTDVARVLLEAGADVRAKTKGGRTALIWAKEKGYTDIVKLLEQAGAKE